MNKDLQYLTSILDTENVDEKHVICYGLHQRGYSYPEIAKHIGFNSHASAMHAIEKVRGQLVYDDMRALVKKACVTVVGIATIPERKNELQNTIDSLYDQVDQIHIYTNGYETTTTDEKITYFTGDDLGDMGKFYQVPENVYYLSCDDDLIYPQGYAKYMKQKTDEYNCPVSLHGKIFNTPITSYYKSGIKFRCLDTVDNDIAVNCIGTGTMCYFTRDASIPQYVNGFMGDIWFSALAQEEKTPLVVVKHEKGYLKYQQVKNTIHQQYVNNDHYQTQIVNKFIKTIHQSDLFLDGGRNTKL